MTLTDWIPLIAALGGGSGIYAVVRALRGRTASDGDRESPVPQERGAARGDRCVTHAELAAALTQHRAELQGRVDAAEEACERRTAETARQSADQSRELADQIRAADRKVERALGMLEVIIEGQSAPSRRGR